MQKDNTRIFDIAIAGAGLVVLSPLFAGIAVWIKCTSTGSVFYFQDRVGVNDTDFRLVKFRTMHVNAHAKRSLTVGTNDDRITGAGAVLRRYKLDELPQLWNVLLGQMSLVGPRPELRKFVALYNSRQKEVLNVKPGITDTASIQFKNENDLLARAPEPEQYYIEYILPAKLEMSRHYMEKKGSLLYFKIIWATMRAIWR